LRGVIRTCARCVEPAKESDDTVTAVNSATVHNDRFTLCRVYARREIFPPEHRIVQDAHSQASGTLAQPSIHPPELAAAARVIESPLGMRVVR
jgi:hypothetical protein